MKKMTAKTGIIAGFIAFAGLAVTAIAWQDSTSLKAKQNRITLDTIPERNLNIDLDLKELDKSLKELDLKMVDVDKTLKNIDWSKIESEVSAALKSVNLDKIQVDVEKALKDINWEKISCDVKASLSKVDMEKMKLEIDKAMKEAKAGINMEEIRKNLEQVKSVNMEKVRKEMEKMKEELQKNKEHMKVDLQKELGKAREEMVKAKAELAETKEMLDMMEKDGLINQSDDFSIELKDKVLYINGKKQSEEVTQKYKRFFKGDNFSIKTKK